MVLEYLLKNECAVLGDICSLKINQIEKFYKLVIKMENQIQKFKKENNNNQLANYKNFKELTK